MRFLQKLPIAFFLFFSTLTFSQATRFEPGLFPENEAFGLTLSPNGRELFFIHSHGGRDTLKLMYSVKRGDQWMKPVPAPFIINTSKIIDPFISPDGKLLLYNSDQPREDGSKKGFDIYGVKKIKNGWGEPFRFNDVINSDSSDFYATISKRGTLFFTSRRGDFNYSNDIYYSVNENGYRTAVRLDSTINTRSSDSNPFISPNEDYLIFFSGKRGGMGGSDLYISFKQEGKWSKAINLAAINTSDGEFCPFVDAKEEYLYFSRTKRVGKKFEENIYRIPLKELKLEELRKEAVQNVN